MVHIFIINANAGDESFSAGLRNHLAERKDIKYYILHTRRDQSETALAQEVLSLFEGEEIRIYSCGGSGTFRNIMAGVDDLSKVEFAFYPRGLTNDFLKTFGDNEKYFRDIDNLIDGKVTMIDYIKTNHGTALNTCSFGLDAVQVSKEIDYSAMIVLGKEIPFLLGFLAAVLRYSPFEIELEIDGVKRTGKFTEVILANGGVIGGALWFDENVDYTDGKGRLALIDNINFINRIRCLFTAAKKNLKGLEKFGTMTYASKMSIKRTDGLPLAIDFDGELQKPQERWDVEIVHKGLKFVVPKEVAADE